MHRIINQKDFRNEIAGSIALNIVQFKSEWSGACQIMVPVYEELARHYEGAANFFIADIEPGSPLEKEYGIHEVPTILFFKDGAIIDYSIGLTSKKALILKIENALSNYQTKENNS